MRIIDAETLINTLKTEYTCGPEIYNIISNTSTVEPPVSYKTLQEADSKINRYLGNMMNGIAEELESEDIPAETLIRIGKCIGEITCEVHEAIQEQAIKLYEWQKG